MWVEVVGEDVGRNRFVLVFEDINRIFVREGILRKFWIGRKY